MAEIITFAGRRGVGGRPMLGSGPRHENMPVGAPVSLIFTRTM
jgi:hypothetical protein